MNTDTQKGLRSEAVEEALKEGLAGRPARLRSLLARHGGLPGPKPNLALAAGFGEAVSSAGPEARGLLRDLREREEEAEDARAFWPIAAAFGYVARLDSDARDAWNGVLELAADERAPVRIGLVAALGAWLDRTPAGFEMLISYARLWLDEDDLQHAFAAQAIVLDVLAAQSDPPAEPVEALEWLDALFERVADAPRSAERSPARRKVLAALPSTLAGVVGRLRGSLDGADWLEARIRRTTHADLRVAIERSLDPLGKGSRALSSARIASLLAALAETAPPPRDPTRGKDRGRGRGRRSRGR